MAKLAGMEPHDLWSRCDRTNIFRQFPGTKPPAAAQRNSQPYRKHNSVGDRFDLHQAKTNVDAMDITGYNLVVLLGLNVAKAFRIKSPRLFQRWYLDEDLNIVPMVASTTEDCAATLLLVFPHPSGVSHYWNSRSNRNKAMQELRAAMNATGMMARKTSVYFQKKKRRVHSKFFKAMHDREMEREREREKKKERGKEMVKVKEKEKEMEKEKEKEMEKEMEKEKEKEKE